MYAARWRGRRRLRKAGVITADEAAQLVGGLRQILDEIHANQLDFNTNDEDIHTLVERRLGEIVGSVAGKLHTGRSRNDQVATDFRLWLMETIDQIDHALHQLQSTCWWIVLKPIGRSCSPAIRTFSARSRSC